MPAFGGVPLTLYFSDAATAAISNLLVVDHRSSGTAAADYGSGVLFSGQDASGNPEQIASIAGVWTVATDGSEASAIVQYIRRAGGALTRKFFHGAAQSNFMYGTVTSAFSFPGIATFETSADDARTLNRSTSTTGYSGPYATCDDTNRVIEMLMHGTVAAGTFFGLNAAGNGFVLSNREVGIGTFAAVQMVLGTNDIAQLTFIPNAGMTANKVLCTGMATSLAAANNLAPDIVGNTVIVTGNTQINLIANTSRPAGTNLTLIFTGTPTVKHATATSGANQTILLSGSVDFVAAANSVLSLVNDGTSWQERARKVA